MALTTYAAGQQISGSAGGTTFSHNRFGTYIRNRSIPINRNTDRMVVVRNAVRSLTIDWENLLTQPQRNAWETYAANVPWTNKLGQSVYLTGLNMYVRSNVPRIQGGAAQVDAGPTVFNLASAEGSLAATASEATQLVIVTVDTTKPWASETGASQFVFMGLPKNSSIKFFGGPWKFAFVVNGADGAPPAGPFPFAAPYPFADGQRLWIRTRISRADGRLSEFARVNFLAAA